MNIILFVTFLCAVVCHGLMFNWTIRNCINVCTTWAILWEIISSDAWWIVCYVICTLGLSANSQGMLPRAHGAQ